MTCLDSAPAPSLLHRLAGGRAERAFAARVDLAFRPDAEAIARVRANLLPQAPARAAAPVPRHFGPRLSVPRLSLPTRGPAILGWRGLSIAAALAIVVAGLAVFAVPARHPFPPSGSIVERPQYVLADLDRSAGHLEDVLAAIRAGDEATLTMELAAYRDELVRLDGDLHRSGADLVMAGDRLRSQAAALATLAGSVPAQDLTSFQDATAELDRIIASLPGAGDDGPTGPNPGATDHPTPSDHPGNTDHPTPSDHPGNTDHPTPSDHPGNTDHPTPSDHPGNTDHPTPSDHPGNTAHPTPHAKSDQGASSSEAATQKGSGHDKAR
jgi:hypothetical protein